MAHSRAVICGLARDIGSLTEALRCRVEALGSMFADYRVVLYENDSRDDTRPQLETWCTENPKAELLTEVRHDPVNPTTRCLARAERMAFYRNQYHNHISERFAAFDFAVVVDTDLAGGWSYEGIADTFGHASWDGVGSYGLIYKRRGMRPNVLLHYDAWAYRFYGSDAPLTCRTVNNMQLGRGEPLLPVNSCFGGLAVYRMPAFLSARYAGGDAEHVPFHRDMRAAGFDRLFLNPSQIALYGRRRRRLDPLYRAWHRTARLAIPSWGPAWRY